MTDLNPRAVLVLALLLFGLPLFVGLGEVDFENDEAFYSYSAERMVALHDWLTPRGMYNRGADEPMLEKPPLKAWIVAGGLAAGLPADEFGLRFFDPLFAIAAFAYVFTLGRRLSGLVCGFVALLVLFAFHPLVFEHGVRTNNMETAMVLTYCGGVYHFFRWRDDDGRRSGHAFACAGWFAFGFLTKLVAALFLPLVMLLAFLWQPDAWSLVRHRWREWIWPAIAALALIAPWFAYETVKYGGAFWQEIVGRQVVTRLTTYLDPTHQRPWHFYLVETWNGFKGSGDRVLLAAGVCWLAVRAWHGRPWLARLMLVWGVVPYALISAASSKLLYYSYPFLPPLALGAGLAAADWLGLWKVTAVDLKRPALQRTFAVVAVVLLAVALWTAWAGPFTWKVLNVRVLRNSSVIRPAVLGAVFLCLTGSIRLAMRAVASLVLVAALPVPAYASALGELLQPRLPLHAIRDCTLNLIGSGAAARQGVYTPDWDTPDHFYFYYFRALGPYVTSPAGAAAEIDARLFQQGRQTPVILPFSRLPALSASARWTTLDAIGAGRFAVILPGPYARCAAAARAAGGSTVRFSDYLH